MEIEFTNNKRCHGSYAYTFSKWEKEAIASYMPKEIKKLRKKIERIEQNPKNEGQVKYTSKIEELQEHIQQLEEIIKEFK